MKILDGLLVFSLLAPKEPEKRNDEAIIIHDE